MTHERILVVDDEKGVVQSCVRILQRQGFVVAGMTDSRDVPHLLKQKTFDVLLTDIRMPKLDGLQLLRVAKEIDPHLTVVLITGYGTMEDTIKAIHLGAHGFLMKPFETEDLVATIEDSLARRTLLRDSLRLQTLLPLLEINKTLQGAEDATTLARRVLDIALRETRAARLTWLNRPKRQDPEAGKNKLVEIAVVGNQTQESNLPPAAFEQVLAQAQPVWLLADGALIDKIEGQATIVGALLPILIKGEVAGLLTAETGQASRAPFDPISLELLSVLVGHLAMIIENVQLFDQTRRLHAFNEDIIRNMTNGLIAINEQHLITAFNPAAGAMLGCKPADLLDQSFETTLLGTGKLGESFQKTLTTGQADARQEITMPRADGSELPISVKTAPLLAGDNNNQTAGVVGVLEDLSERKAMEEERRRLDRLAALGEMSAVVAHEIRNPIASIAAGVEYLSAKMAPDSAEAQGAAMIQTEIQRVNRILEDILFVARPFQLNLSVESLAEIIEDVVRRCRPQTQTGQVEIFTIYDPAIPALKVDRQRLDQVFTNLIINATQAMQTPDLPTEVRRLVIETGLVSPAEHPGSENQAKHVVITFTDTGPGISAEAQQRIFEPFFTTKARGTGLGLSVARRVMEEHQGAIKIDADHPNGTRFIITLPIPREEVL